MKKILAVLVAIASFSVADDCILGQISYKEADGSFVNIKKACFEGKMFLLRGNSIVQINGVDCVCPKQPE